MDSSKVVVISVVMTFLLVISLLLGLAIGISFFNIRCFDNVPVKCWVDNQLVYDGISAGINIKSTGYTTRVDIRGGFLYWFPREYYVSQNVKLEGKK